MRAYIICAALVLPVAGCSLKTNQEQIITLAEYRQVKTGQTLQEVESIVGATGEFTGEDDNWQSYRWMNKDGSGMVVSFDGGKVKIIQSIKNLY